jgi:hypothetical protein
LALRGMVNQLARLASSDGRMPVAIGVQFLDGEVLARSRYTGAFVAFGGEGGAIRRPWRWAGGRPAM